MHLRKTASQELCRSLVLSARRLCMDLVDPAWTWWTLPALPWPAVSSLIALNKNPGVLPIGIEETARRMMAKAILSVNKQDL